jgi:hypothetical protein
MRRWKPVIALAAGLFSTLVAPASAELHQFSVTLVTGQTITMTIDVAPDGSIGTIQIAGLPAEVRSITDLGPLVTPTSEQTAMPAPATAPITGAEAPQGAALRYLKPFPVVRIRGSVATRGANVTLLRVTAPARATVTVRCAGDGCPIRQSKTNARRLHAFERFLRAGVRITIRVHREGYIGKYVRLRIRAGKPPARHDACVLPGSRRPVTCPVA